MMEIHSRVFGFHFLHPFRFYLREQVIATARSKTKPDCFANAYAYSLQRLLRLNISLTERF